MLDLGRRNPSLAVSFTPRIGKSDLFGFLVVAMNDPNMPAVLNVGFRFFADAFRLFAYRFGSILRVDRFSSVCPVIRNTIENSVECNSLTCILYQQKISPRVLQARVSSNKVAGSEGAR